MSPGVSMDAFDRARAATSQPTPIASSNDKLWKQIFGMSESQKAMAEMKKEQYKKLRREHLRQVDRQRESIKKPFNKHEQVIKQYDPGKDKKTLEIERIRHQLGMKDSQMKGDPAKVRREMLRKLRSAKSSALQKLKSESATNWRKTWDRTKREIRRSTLSQHSSGEIKRNMRNSTSNRFASSA